MLSDIYTPVKHNNAPIISQRPLTAVRPPPICGAVVSLPRAGVVEVSV